jgi:hypothetical protein
MKEIWKLIELLGNWDWRNVTYNKQSDWGYMFRLGDLAFREERICSKKFWFIKWIVENDKIDKKKIDTRLVRNVESHYDEEWYWVENSYEDYSDTDTLLMLLSISDTPIEDLISYLK